MTPEERLREIAERIRRRAEGLPEEPAPVKPLPKPAGNAAEPEPHWSEQDEREEA